MRGYAPTDLAPDGAYQMGALAKDASELCKALGGDERAVLIGHDWGAVATWINGAADPGRFSRMVAIAVPPTGELFSPSALARNAKLMPGQTANSWYICFQQLPGISERMLPSVIKKLWADWSPGFDATEDLQHVADSLSGPGRRTAALRYYRAFAQPWYRKSAYAAEQKHWMGIPDVPVLYIHGRNDGCMRAELAESLDAAKLPPGSRVEILDGVGHFLQLEDPVRVNPLIADFVGSALASNPPSGLAAH